MAQLQTDLLACCLVGLTVFLKAGAIVDRRCMASKLFVTFAGVRGAQFVEAFQAIYVQDLACRFHSLLQEGLVAFVLGEQVVAANGRGVTGCLQCVPYVLSRCYPSWRICI